MLDEKRLPKGTLAPKKCYQSVTPARAWQLPNMHPPETHGVKTGETDHRYIATMALSHKAGDDRDEDKYSGRIRIQFLHGVKWDPASSETPSVLVTMILRNSPKKPNVSGTGGTAMKTASEWLLAFNVFRPPRKLQPSRLPCLQRST